MNHIFFFKICNQKICRSKNGENILTSIYIHFKSNEIIIAFVVFISTTFLFSWRAKYLFQSIWLIKHPDCSKLIYFLIFICHNYFGIHKGVLVSQTFCSNLVSGKSKFPDQRSVVGILSWPFIYFHDYLKRSKDRSTLLWLKIILCFRWNWNLMMKYDGSVMQKYIMSYIEWHLFEVLTSIISVLWNKIKILG